MENGEPREVMHFALLIGYGASAVNPYLAIETSLEDIVIRGLLPAEITAEKAVKNFIKSIDKGLLEDLLEDGHLHFAKLSWSAGL